MESDTNQETFGGYLKDCRLKREMAIETVAATTKIAVNCLKAIEANAHDRLPQQAYVKGFIRTYANALGADANDAVALYLADIEQQENTKQRQLRRRANLWAVRRTLMALGVIVGILLLLRYTDMVLDSAPPPRIMPSEGADRPAPSTTGSATVDRQPAASRTRDKLKLQVIAVEQTWLKVIVDGQNARSYHLKPEDRLELEGIDNFNLMIGNATGLKIFLDDRPVKIFGSSGQVVSLKIP